MSSDTPELKKQCQDVHTLEQEDELRMKMYLKEINGQIAYSVITPDAEVENTIVIAEDIITEIKAPSPFTLENLKPLRDEILSVSSQARHTQGRSSTAAASWNTIDSLKYMIIFTFDPKLPISLIYQLKENQFKKHGLSFKKNSLSTANPGFCGLFSLLRKASQYIYSQYNSNSL